MGLAAGAFLNLGYHGPIMSRKVISTGQAPAAIGPYSQAIQCGNLLFCSGQIPLDPTTGEFVGRGDIRAQTVRVMENLGAVLNEAGVGFDAIAKATIFLTSLDDFAAVNDVYAGYFGNLEEAPARACVQVSALPKAADVEVEAIAVLPTR